MPSTQSSSRIENFARTSKNPQKSGNWTPSALLVPQSPISHENESLSQISHEWLWPRILGNT